jgi:hypothetical protein
MARCNWDTIRFSSLRGSPVSATSWLLRGTSKRSLPSTETAAEPGMISVSIVVRPPFTVWSYRYGDVPGPPP